MAYYLTAYFSLEFTQSTNGLATIWPASGIFVAALLLAKRGPRMPIIATVAAASLISNTQFGASSIEAAGYTVANIVEGVVIAQLVRRGANASRELDNTRWLMTFLIATVFGSFVSGAVASLLAGHPSLPFFVSWSLTVCLGTLIVVPFVITVVTGLRERGAFFLLRDAAVLTGLTLAVSVIGSFIFDPGGEKYLFLPVVGVIVATYLFGASGASVSISLVAITATLHTDFASSGAGILGLNQDILFLQVYLVCLFCAVWPLSALIANREHLLARYAEANGHLELAESTASVGHWYFDKDGSSLVWSDEVYRIHGVRADDLDFSEGVELENPASLALYHPDDREVVRAILLDALSSEQGFSYRARILRPDGTYRHVSSIGHPRFGSDGEFDGLFGTVQDVTRETEVLEQLRIARVAAVEDAKTAKRLAETDELTGIANRRKILGDLRTVSRSGRAAAQQVTIAILDVDHFKSVNDQHGHQAGDTVLKRVARIISDELRSTDYFGRLGGEEFLVVLPGENGMSASLILERLRKRIAQERWQAPGLAQVTISAGVATMTEDETMETVLRRADDALYQAKENGRNLLQIAA
ncbi:sensor domain-containing diguanylate cyclase [Sphingomicrobium clamense]|uniref:diguanylate cyclase n=1 Tax=Sphingomicrobium clamense TaxID=2851013 RepID=A0ABS6V752_9SPHN|nr:sensor domain-containing diguanylate cyclase [Sphingomicrobium sp. B8]MBW0145399.1 diguanylate cyclase [Sphingomicrobium sp. B8]